MKVCSHIVPYNVWSFLRIKCSTFREFICQITKFHQVKK